MNAKFDAAKIDALSEKLKAMPKVETTPVLTKREAVARLRPEIRAMQRRGYTLEQVAQVLAGEGIAITPSTLKGYMRTPKKKAGAEKAA